MAFDSSPEGLAALEARLRRDLTLLCYPPDDWVPPATGGQHDVDVAVVGAGMCGLTAGFALLRSGIRKLRILDARPAGQEGPWVTYARMQTLRSPKHLTGPALGLPALTFRAWFEAQWGSAGWSDLGRISRTLWMDYLCWYRKVLELPVTNNLTVRAIAPLPARDGGGFALRAAGDAQAPLKARKVVLAMGRESLAAPRIPPVFAPFMGARCQHTSEDIDFAALRGKRVAVIGVAASALDNAAEALEAGAQQVHVLARSAVMPRVNKAKAIVYAGFTEGFPGLDDDRKLRLLEYIARCGLPAPRDTVLRVARHPGFRLHMGKEVKTIRLHGEALALSLGRETLLVEHVIVGTGFRIDLDAAPEIADLAPYMARWRDRHDPQPALADSEYLDFPYLGESFQFTERNPGETPALRDLYCFSHAASMSQGNVSGDIPAVSDGAWRLARGIARDLFLDDVQTHQRRLEQYEDAELLGDELDLEAWWPPLG